MTLANATADATAERLASLDDDLLAEVASDIAVLVPLSAVCRGFRARLAPQLMVVVQQNALHALYRASAAPIKRARAETHAVATALAFEMEHGAFTNRFGEAVLGMQQSFTAISRWRDSTSHLCKAATQDAVLHKYLEGLQIKDSLQMISYHGKDCWSQKDDKCLDDLFLEMSVRIRAYSRAIRKRGLSASRTDTCHGEPAQRVLRRVCEPYLPEILLLQTALGDC
eukprot:2496754-Prymnesium_polylepis.1